MRERALRILYSFPDTVGDPGIGAAALHYVRGLGELGHEVLLYCTSGGRHAGAARTVETLGFAGARVPHRALGRARSYRYHDRRTARALSRLREPVDVVHVWPRATLATSRAAHALGVPVVREVPNTHTAFAYARVAEETALCGLEPVPGHSHTPDPAALALEEHEYECADLLAVPSEYSRCTFLERGFDPERLRLHRYGFDPRGFPPPPPRPHRPDPARGLRAVFVGRCEPRKGLHLALDAWLASGAAERGTLTICGSFYPGYREYVQPLLDHPSVTVAGFVDDVPTLMGASDVLLLPSVEDGSALVTYEAQAMGCVPLVSDAAGARLLHMESGIVHTAGDAAQLAEHIRAVDRDRALLERLRAGVLARRDSLTWEQGARDLEKIYLELVARGPRDGGERHGTPLVLA
jgi:glycosyltransferase involved in cell wall biosynthesis